jgi:hypothetical protein
MNQPSRWSLLFPALLAGLAFGQQPKSPAGLSVWFERVYEKRDGHWLYVSHRTVHGLTYRPGRQSVSDK